MYPPCSLNKAWDMVRKDGKLTGDNIKEPMREIRRALLEADVSSAARSRVCVLGGRDPARAAGKGRE